MTAAVEIITTGSELLEGLYADTNSRLISERLFAWGYDVVFHTSVGDDPIRAARALETAAARADIVVVTGGIGPTDDDCNRDVIAGWTRRPLVRDAAAEQMIRDLFARRGRSLPESNLKQADIPEGALPLYNHFGTAAAFIVPGDAGGPAARPAIIALPGPQREFTVMLDGPVREFLFEHYTERAPRRVETLQTAGVPESEINGRIKDLWTADEHVRLTLLASPLCVTARIIAAGEDDAAREALAARFKAEIIARVGAENILGVGDATLEEAVGRVFREKGITLCAAESCTGGLLSALLTDAPGSSAYVKENFVTYSNEAKVRRLGVREATLAAHGAVSEACAAEMAAGARRASGADVAVAITGIAGPDGGTAEKPVGLVFIALDDGSRPEPLTRRHHFPGDRETIRLWAARTAMDWLRRWGMKK